MTLQPQENAVVALAQTGASAGLERAKLIGEFGRFAVIGTMAFLTLVDLFATQAILPSLAAHYGTTPAQTGIAVNATTLGMAIASLGIALFARRIDRRDGIVWSLCALAVPTALLAFAPNLPVFAALRVAQGLCMASAFALTLAYLGEHASARNAAGVFAAYITGNVASNLIGRLCAAFFVDHYGLAGNFLAFAALNLLGAALTAVTLERAPPIAKPDATDNHPFVIWGRHLATPGLPAAFGVGFCILFAFVGTFTYVNFVLARPPLGLGMMQIGLVYLVFAPSIATTALAGRLAATLGPRVATGSALCLAAGRRGGAAHPVGQLGARGFSSCRHRDLPRAGGDYRLRWPRRAIGSRRGKRSLSRRLFCRRARWQRRVGRPVRHVGMDGVRGRNHRCTSYRCHALYAVCDP